MALYVLGDLHLSLGADKPMDVFGGAWEGYMDKLQAGLSVLQPEDTIVLLGDVSWALSLPEARADFAFLHGLPGRKILVKGNHDYWWSTAAKFDLFCQENGFSDLFLLHNNFQLYGDTALCGSRGWSFEEDGAGTHNEKIYHREILRLEASLKAAGDREKLCFLHYPPCYRGYRCPEILQLLEQYGVKRCFYGHLHGASHKLAMEGRVGETEFSLVSADYVNFLPKRIL